MLERLSTRLIRLPRLTKQGLALVLDTSLLTAAVWAAYTLRLGEWFVPEAREWLLLIIAPFIAAPVFSYFGLYRSVIRYVGEQALWAIFKGMLLAAALWAIPFLWFGYTEPIRAPFEVVILYVLVGSLLIAGARFAFRWLLWLPIQNRYNAKPAIIYGAGEAGRQLLASLRQSDKILPMLFLDDDASRQGTDVSGLRVYSPKELPKLIRQFDIQEIIVTQDSQAGTQQRKLLTYLGGHSVQVRILPPIYEFVQGRHIESMVRQIDIGDLLGRQAMQADHALLEQCITGKNVMVTGAGGSIGSELCHQIATLAPASLVVLEANEYALYQINKTLSETMGEGVHAYLGSVTHAEQVREILQRHQIHTLYHAAAHKHVPLVEGNILEGVRNNVFGTWTLMDEAYRAGVKTVVQISTDKAVRPSNVMGATKRWAEIIIQHFANKAQQERTGQHYCAVRFGNVLGSSGSVIPLFKEQINRGGPLTVTHPEVTRYFMSIHEAVALVIQAGSMSLGSEIFLLEMGEPIHIQELAENLIRLSGKTHRSHAHPTGDIEIVHTGLRPGEKLHEELVIAENRIYGTRHPQIMRADEPVSGSDRLLPLLEQLKGAVAARDTASTRQLLMQLANPQAAGAQIFSLAEAENRRRTSGSPS